LRSRAWGRLLASTFPHAVRLSIHPQAAVSDKIGIHLLPTQDAWLTPWHGVALLDRERFRLVKRAEAEELGAAPVDVDGRPSHYVVPS
jgi:pyoverdine/dityrosine biosynthesis protein Dit1